MARKVGKPQRRGVFPFAISLYAVGRREISERPFYSFASLREKKTELLSLIDCTTHLVSKVKSIRVWGAY